MSTKANSERIRELRIRKGLSQEKLAEEAKLGHRTIQRIEEGGHARPATLRAVADVLGVSIPEIVAAGASVEPSLAAVHRAIGEKLRKLAESGKAMAAASKTRIEVLEIAPLSDDDDDRESPIVVAIQQLLRDLGYETCGSLLPKCSEGKKRSSHIAPANLGVKLARPGSGPAAELPTSLPA